MRNIFISSRSEIVPEYVPWKTFTFHHTVKLGQFFRSPKKFTSMEYSCIYQ